MPKPLAPRKAAAKAAGGKTAGNAITVSPSQRGGTASDTVAGGVTSAQRHTVPVGHALLPVGAVLFDAVYVPDGDAGAHRCRARADAARIMA